MADDDLTAALEEVKRHHWQHVCENHPEPGICVTRDGRWPCDAARSVAAVEAVLKLHQPVNRGEGLEPICGTCTRGFWPCETCRAITRELSGDTGKEAGDGAT